MVPRKVNARVKLMSQKRRDFQSKPRSKGGKPGGEKFGGKTFGGGGRDGGFSKKFEGDSRFESKGGRGFGGKGHGKKPRFGDGEGRRDDRFGGDKPRGKPRFDRDREGGGGDRPFGDRKAGGKKFGGKKFGGKKFGDKKPGGKKFDDRKFGDRDDRRPQKTWQRHDEGARGGGEASFETRQRLKSDRPGHGAPSSAFLYGVHAVSAALLNPKRVHQRLLCTTNGYEAIEEACREALENGLRVPEVTYVEGEDIARLLPRDAVHQGVLLDAQPLEEVFLADILISAAEDAKIIVLDQVTDPHNVGAILRSAAAFGAVAVVAQKLNAPDITGTLAKAASGAVEHVPLVREVNLSRALEQMKEAGFTCLGLAEKGKRTLAEARAEGRVAFVLGAEGEGLRRLVSETCDELVRLPTGGAIGSLNVSNAAAVALYEMARG